MTKGIQQIEKYLIFKNGYCIQMVMSLWSSCLGDLYLLPALSPLGNENHSFTGRNGECVFRTISKKQQLSQLEVTDLVWDGEAKTCVFISQRSRIQF